MKNSDEAIQEIHSELSGKEWSPDTFERIKDILLSAGLEIKEPQHMNRYEIVLCDLSVKSPKNRWTMMLTADNFGDAEDQAKDIILENNSSDEVIAINKELDD